MLDMECSEVVLNFFENGWCCHSIGETDRQTERDVEWVRE